MTCIDACCYGEHDHVGYLMCNGGSEEEIRAAYEKRDRVPYEVKHEKYGKWNVTSYYKVKLSPVDQQAWLKRNAARFAK